MSWDVIQAIGGLPEDEPEQGARARPLAVVFEGDRSRSHMRENVIGVIQDSLQTRPGVVAIDLVRLAMTVFAADMAIPRGSASSSEAIDGWTRDIRLSLGMSVPDVWRGVEPLLQELLGFLSGDRWSVEIKAAGSVVDEGPRQTPVDGVLPEEVCLFSGGLDSLCGAINLLDQQKRLALVGHYSDSTTTPGVQRRVADVLHENYGDLVNLMQFFIRPPSMVGESPERSQRSRSLLFITIGIAVANALGDDVPVTVAENGFLSLNVPMTDSRSGSLSTRTTHPHFIRMIEELLRELGLSHELRLPFCHETKGEVLKNVRNRAVLKATAPLTMSCAHPDQRRYKGLPPGTHCGCCLPCIVRRAAMYRAGLEDAEYDSDVLSVTECSGSAGADLRAVQMAVARFRPERSWIDVLDSGPMDPEDLEVSAKLYERGIRELGRFLKSAVTG